VGQAAASWKPLIPPCLGPPDLLESRNFRQLSYKLEISSVLQFWKHPKLVRCKLSNPETFSPRTQINGSDRRRLATFGTFRKPSTMRRFKSSRPQDRTLKPTLGSEKCRCATYIVEHDLLGPVLLHPDSLQNPSSQTFKTTGLKSKANPPF
jgi:hypothetical protein